jgi:outer membrane protein OmpA-like peptidoglycan-associated protein
VRLPPADANTVAARKQRANVRTKGRHIVSRSSIPAASSASGTYDRAVFNLIKNKMNRLRAPLQLALMASTLAFSMMLAGCQTPPPAVAAPAYSGPVLPIEQSERGVQIFLPSSVLFELGKADLNLAAAGPYVDRVATLLKTKTTKQVSVEGHADNQGSDQSNQVLSEARAQSLMVAMAERGVPAGQLAWWAIRSSDRLPRMPPKKAAN